MKRQLSVAEQSARRAALDVVAATRPLNPVEQAERESLENRLYHRVWRQQQREAQLALDAKIHARLAAQVASKRQRLHAA